MKASCKQKVNAVLGKHAGTRKNGKVASERTETMTKDVVYAAFRRLSELGFKLDNPENLQNRHIEALVKHWWYEQKKRAKTIQNDLSRLRRFAAMMGKHGMVKSMGDYLPDVPKEELTVIAVAQQTKSPAGNDVDIQSLLEKADARDFRLGLMLRMELAFGLRREEALKCDPHLQDHGEWFEILAGQGKGGRPRNIIVMNESQRQILDYVKKLIPKGEKLGWAFSRSGAQANLKGNLKRYSNLMTAIGFTKKNLGVTGHGLRAQFAENNALLHGIIPPSLGGKKGQHEKAEQKVRLKKLSQAMGHNRENVMGSYYGSFKTSGNSAEDQAREIILRALEEINVSLSAVGEERREDCLKIQSELQKKDLDLTLRQVQYLWQKWSERCGVAWAKPGQEILLPLSSALVNTQNK